MSVAFLSMAKIIQATASPIARPPPAQLDVVCGHASIPLLSIGRLLWSGRWRAPRVSGHGQHRRWTGASGPRPAVALPPKPDEHDHVPDDRRAMQNTDVFRAGMQ